MNFVQFLFIISLVYLIFYLPGRILISKINLTWEEKFAGSFAVSVLIYFTISFLSFLLPFPSAIINPLLLLTLFFILAAVFLRFPFSIPKQELTLVLLFFLGFIFILVIQSLLPYYTGAGWTFDWLEHYQRAIFFLDKNLTNPYFGQYHLTARPPLFNLTASFFMSLFGRDFYIFQIISTLLNFSVILPCFLLCRYLVVSFAHTLLNKTGDAREASKTEMYRSFGSPSGRTRIRIKRNLCLENYQLTTTLIFITILSVLLLNPAFIRQITYTWTKASASFFFLMGLYFYLRYRSGQRYSTIILAFVFFAMSILTHYSSIPFVLLVILYELIKTLIKLPRGKLSLTGSTKFIGAIFCLIIVLAPWYFYSVSRFGFQQTFLGNTSYQWQKDLSFSARLNKDINNLRHTFIPLIPAKHLQMTDIEPGSVTRFYDRAIALYATTLPGTLTFTLSLFFIIYLIFFIRTLSVMPNLFRHPIGILQVQDDNKLSVQNNIKGLFWPYFIISGIILGTMVNGNEDILGIAHISLLPLSLILICFGVSALMSLMDNNRFIAILIILFLAAESLLGTGSMLYATNVEINQPNLEKLSFSQYGAIHTHWDNVVAKPIHHLTFLADRFSSLQPVFIAILILGWLMLVFALIIVTLKNPLSR